MTQSTNFIINSNGPGYSGRKGKTMTRRIISKTGFLEQYSKAELDHDVEVCQEDDWDKTKVLKGPCAVFDHGEWSIKYKDK